MVEKLQKLLNNSYSPYSKFKVACIITLKDGNEVNGVNVENASLGATICAERSAICSAISKGYKKGDFKELHVMVDHDKIGTCCFMCRQVISEFFSGDSIITCYNKNGLKQTFTVQEFCPHPFNEENLK